MTASVGAREKPVPIVTAPHGLASGTDVPINPIVERPTLLRLLDNASKSQFTVITAPAGSGKTVLVRSWVQTRGPAEPHAWVSVERGERDPQRFWGSLIAAVSRASSSEAAPDELVPAPAFNAELASARLVADLTALSRLTIVIDDVHEIQSADLLEQLTHFLDKMPGHIRVVLIARHDPPLGLHRRRLEGQVTELRIDQLRFTVDESRQLLTAAGIDLSEDGLRLLHGRTEGWVAGLRLATVSMATHSDPERFVSEFSGSERTVAEYLMAEVLDSLAPDVRRLLVNTSILDRVNGELGDLLTGDVGSEHHLSRLAEAGEFVIPLDARGEWFRLHHLFADLLETELRHAQAGRVAGLHLSAARWLSSHGYVLEAIGHALAADDHDLVVSLLIEHYFTLMLDGQQLTVRTMIDTAVGRAATPELAAVVAADELIGGSLDQAAAHLSLAERRADEVSEDRRDRFEMMLYVTRLSLARRIGDFQSLLDAPQPAALYSTPLSTEDILMQSDVRALMLMNLGIAEVWSGRREDGEAHLRAAKDIAEQIGRPYVEVSCLAHQAQSLSWRSFTDARPVAEEALAAAERHGWQDDPVTGASLVVLGSCLLSTGMTSEAERAFQRADEILRSDLEPAIGFVLHTGHGIVNLVRGNYPEAIANLLESERMGEMLVVRSPLALPSRCAMVYAAIVAGDLDRADRALEAFTGAERDRGEVREVIALRALAEGDAPGALAALRPTVHESAEVHHDMTLIRSLLLDAQAHYLLGEDLNAQHSVERALGLAEPDSLILPFLWVQSSELLERHPRYRTAHGAFLATILDSLSGQVFDVQNGRTRPADVGLSETELRILRFLPTNLTAAEIASEIYVSVNTVKTHMRNIYAKLNAHSRGQAVEYARASGLLSNPIRSR